MKKQWLEGVAENAEDMRLISKNLWTTKATAKKEESKGFPGNSKKAKWAA